MSPTRTGATRGRKRARRPDAPDLFSSLPLDVISTHILRPAFLPEPGELGRLRAVSHRMRDAVDATKREIKEVSNRDAMCLGYVSLLKDRHTRGLLESSEYTYLCAAAARNGDPEALKALRADDYPWGALTCAYAAWGSHLEVLKWARENGCPWDRGTCSRAARGGHIDIVKWARENGAPMSENTRLLAAKKGYVGP